MDNINRISLEDYDKAIDLIMAFIQAFFGEIDKHSRLRKSLFCIVIGKKATTMMGRFIREVERLGT